MLNDCRISFIDCPGNNDPWQPITVTGFPQLMAKERNHIYGEKENEPRISTQILYGN